MELGVVGLGRMGAAIARRVMRAGHGCVVFDRDPAPGAALASDGATAVASLEALVDRLVPPRRIWLMLPAGAITEAAVESLGERLGPGDVLIDGGNSFYRDDVRRATDLAKRGVAYLDVGTSGGVWGLERGFCLMVGGDRQAFETLEPIFAALAPGLGSIERTQRPHARDDRAERGYIHAGPPGAGHFVKMVHNGIEYGMMQAYAEGFALLRAQDGGPGGSGEGADLPRYDLDLPDVAEVWRRGSVVASWLLDLIAGQLADAPDLAGYGGVVADTGEGRWTLENGIARAVPMPALAAALFARFRSRQDHGFADKMLSAMRMGFGGHKEAPAAADRQG